MMRPGYAIEYDFYEPRQTHAVAEVKAIEGLFFAGQITGRRDTRRRLARAGGRNEAVRRSGMRAGRARRDDGYVGVLIDDLVTAVWTSPTVYSRLDGVPTPSSPGQCP